MDCLRSFSIAINQNRTFNVAGTNVKTWGTLGNYHWVIVEQGGTSIIDIEGFKRLDIYGVELLGNVQTDTGLNDGAIIQDWSFRFSIGGQVPLVNAVTRPSPNFWAIIGTVSSFDLGKYSNRVNFETPYTGVTGITFDGFRAQGNNGETLNSISLDLNLQFVFYYKYDGE
jgi:hypothetical protein